MMKPIVASIVGSMLIQLAASKISCPRPIEPVDYRIGVWDRLSVEIWNGWNYETNKPEDTINSYDCMNTFFLQNIPDDGTATDGGYSECQILATKGDTTHGAMKACVDRACTRKALASLPQTYAAVYGVGATLRSPEAEMVR